MSSKLQRDLISGEVAGLIAGIALVLVIQLQGGAGVFDANMGLLGFALTGTELVLHLLTATLAGGLFGALFRLTRRGQALLMSGGIFYAFLLWILGPLTVAPLLVGEMPTWAIAEARLAFMSLWGHLLYGLLLGILSYSVGRLFHRAGALDRDEVDEVVEEVEGIQHVVVVGGGEAGVNAARILSERFYRSRAVEVTLISDNNDMIFKSKLPQLVSAAVEPRHIVAPIKSAAPFATFRYARVSGIAPAKQIVRARDCATGCEFELCYSQLILALGANSAESGTSEISCGVFRLISPHDAIKLREHVLNMLVIADHELNPARKREQLSFVVVGGGLAGTQLVAELHDFVQGQLHYLKNISRDDVKFGIVHPRDRLLPEWSEGISVNAQASLKVRGIDIMLNKHVVKTTENSVLLSDETLIPTRTVVFTMGQRPDELLNSIGAEQNAMGAVKTDEFLRVEGLNNIWAIGDCAHVRDPVSQDRACPPTTQMALHQSDRAAANVIAVLRGREKGIRPFTKPAGGVIIGMGRYSAIGEIKGVRVSGLFAWLIWRKAHLLRLPGMQKRVRVMLDWSLDLVFPRDIGPMELNRFAESKVCEEVARDGHNGHHEATSVEAHGDGAGERT